MADLLLIAFIISCAFGAGWLVSRAFPVMEPVAPPRPVFDMTDEHVARIAHEANRAYCITLGDLSQRSWNNAPEWQRQSCINGVRLIRGNIGATPEQVHENWMREKIEQGWRYGRVKCVVERTHPYIRPYDELPEAQRFKDYLFHAVVSLAAVRGA